MKDFRSLLLGSLMLAACASQDGAPSSSAVSNLPSAAIEAVDPPTFGRLNVTDDCARVTVDGGAVWHESCSPPSFSRPQQIFGEAAGQGQRALLRVFDGATVVASSDPGIRYSQEDGWILLETQTFDFTFTLSVSESTGQGDDYVVVCDYNPFFIDCDET